MSTHDMSAHHDDRPLRLDRRQFGILLAGAAAVPVVGVAPEGDRDRGGPGGHGRRSRTSLYASTGPQLWRYEVDRRALTLQRAEAVDVPAAIQYAWRHPVRPLLYVAYSDRAGADPGSVHGIATFRVDGSGVLTRVGADRALPSRPIHVTVDGTGSWVLVAYNAPSAVEVYPVGRDGTPGPVVVQREPVDAGVYAHQVRVLPSDRTVVLATRGNDATATTPEDPGALKVFDLVHGQLRNERSVAPDGGLGFGPRHVDVHPARPWLHVSDERANELRVFALRRGRVGDEPLHSVSTLASPDPSVPHQVAGAVHVSADGSVVYVANRADGTVEVHGQPVFAGGENSIAVFRLARDGEPARVQNAPTESFHVRTFSLHPRGGMLVAASVAPMRVRDGDTVRTVPARLTVFGVGRDGTLDLARTYDVDTSTGTQFWCGFVEH